VAIRSTTTPGTITVTATRAGLAPATVTVESHPVAIAGGLTTAMPPTFAGPMALPKL
jgi:beta-galactosidase